MRFEPPTILIIHTEFPTTKFLTISGSEIYTTMPQARIDPQGQSHASYEASALPPNHQGWIYFVEVWLSNNSPKIRLTKINVHDYANGRNLSNVC